MLESMEKGYLEQRHLEQEAMVSGHSGRKHSPSGVGSRFITNALELLASVIHFMVLIYMILIGVILPFYFEKGYVRIATDKANFFNGVSSSLWQFFLPVLAVYALLKGLGFLLEKDSVERQKANLFRVSPVDVFMALYAFSVVISYLCSEYKSQAFWGAEGWYMGMLPQLFLVGAYFLISKAWKPGKWFLYLLFGVSAVVFFLGCLNRFGYYPIKMQGGGPLFLSTIGNINWLCGYSVTLFFVGVALFWQETGKWWRKLLLGVYVWLGFCALITQGSLGGIFTVGFMMLIFFYLSVKDGGRMRNFWLLAVLFSAACLSAGVAKVLFGDKVTFWDEVAGVLTDVRVAIVLMLLCVGMWLWGLAAEKKGIYPAYIMWKIAWGLGILLLAGTVLIVALIAVNTISPGILGICSEYGFFTFSREWGSYRGATWRAGVYCFYEQDLLHKLVGVGPDAMSAYIKRDAGMLLAKAVGDWFGTNLVLTNAHNEWLNLLANLGILGMVAFGGMMISAVKSLWKSREIVPVACLAGVLAYTINNLISFQQTMNMTAFIMVLGIGQAFLKNSRKKTENFGA